MDISEIKDLDTLFTEWQNKHSNETDEEYRKYHNKKIGETGYISKENFFIDGYISNETFNGVLFIAKECNLGNDSRIHNKDSKDSFWLSEQLESENRSNFVSGLAMLINAFINNNYEDANKKSYNSLNEAAFINLNKRGGYNYCVWNTLEEYVKKYKEFIKREIEIINPKTIICCGPCVKDLLVKYVVGNDNRIKVAYHPGYPISDYSKLQFFKTGKKCEPTQESKKTREQRCYIFDTNNRWGEDPQCEMLKDKKAIAYGDARHFIKWFRPGDGVLLYSKNKKSIIAAGTVKNVCTGSDNDEKSWLELDDFIDGSSNPLCISKVNNLVYSGDFSIDTDKKINMNGTVKRKIIKMEHFDIIKEKMGK